MPVWGWVLLGEFAVVLVALYIAHRLDQWERNLTRGPRRLGLRAQAHEEMKRIDFLYPSDPE